MTQEGRLRELREEIMQVPVYVLGISGSPRPKGGTAYLTKVALKTAEELPNVTTKYISLHDKKMFPCRGCSTKQGKFLCPELRKCPFNDDIETIKKEILKSDGMIFGTPTYGGCMSAQLKILCDRLNNLKYGLTEKVLAAISVGAHRDGGQDLACLTIMNYGFMHGMIVINDGPAKDIERQKWKDVREQGTMPIVRARMRIGVSGLMDLADFDSIERDNIGICRAEGLGHRIAEVSKWVKVCRTRTEWYSKGEILPTKM